MPNTGIAIAKARALCAPPTPTSGAAIAAMPNCNSPTTAAALPATVA